MSKPRRRHDASRLAFGETVRHSAFEGVIVSKRLGSPYVSGRTRPWLKFKNPAAAAVKREGGGVGEGAVAMTIHSQAATAAKVERIVKVAKASFFDAVDFLACIEVLEAGNRREIDRAVAAANAGRAADLVKRALFGHCLMSVITAFDPERSAGDFHLGVGMKLVADPITRERLLKRNGANVADIESAQRRWADCLNFEPLTPLRTFRNKSVAHMSDYSADMEQPVVHQLFELARMTAEVAEHLAHGTGIAAVSLDSQVGLFRESGRAFWDKWYTAEDS